jgi:hypothetical protein
LQHILYDEFKVFLSPFTTAFPPWTAWDQVSPFSFFPLLEIAGSGA